MSYLAGGPVHRTGIDRKASADKRRHAYVCMSDHGKEASA